MAIFDSLQGGNVMSYVALPVTHQRDLSRLIVFAKRLGVIGTPIIVGVVAGAILVGGYHGGALLPGEPPPIGTTIPGDVPHNVPGEPPHIDTTDTLPGPAKVITQTVSRTTIPLGSFGVKQ
jgi:hypothetical protein